MIDYHIHLERGPYNIEWLKKFWKQAQRRGITEIGFTEHSHRFHEFWPTFEHLIDGNKEHPFMQEWLNSDFKHSITEYLDLLHEAREQGIPVKIGIEVDYMTEVEESIRQILDEYSFDFVLGSVHILDKWAFDISKESWHVKEVNEIYKKYFAALTKAAAFGMFDIMSHLDVVKVFGYRATDTFDEEIEELLSVIAKQGLCIEVSTAGLRKDACEIYPSESILKKANMNQIPITIASDAHQPEDVGYEWEKAIILARRCGYREYRVFSDRQSHAEKIPK